MSINYEEEIISILENNEIKVLPSKALIQSNERIAKAVWKNYIHSERDDDGDYDNYNYSFEKWYKAANWGDLLKSYSNNTQLWEELLASRFYKSYYNQNNSSYDFILSSTFRQDFPEIADYFLTNNDKLIELFNKTHNDEFFKRISLDPKKKEDLYKVFLIDSSRNIKDELIKEYESDGEFVTKLLTKYPGYFSKLNKENKNNIENIKIALRDMDNFFLINDENKNKFFKSWVKNYGGQIKLKMLDKLNSEQQCYVLEKRKDLLSSALNSEHSKHKDIATSILLNSLEENINVFDDKALNNFAKNKKNLDKIYPQLKEFIDNYTGLGFDKKENKMVLLCRYFDDLKEELQENIFYKLTKIKESNQKMDKGWFISVNREVIDLFDQGKIEKSKAEAFVSISRNCLTIDALKELRIPKLNAFDYVSAIILHGKLQEQLSNDGSNGKKMKI